MNICRVVLVTIALVLPCGAQAQAIPTDSEDSKADSPRGAPYHTAQSDSASVPLRDYLSSRIDQLRVEMFDRLDQLDRAQQKVIDERDQRYSQRFQAQQEALTAALQAAKEQVANALSAAKEAVTKAETAVEKRFESVNEFRGQLDDQAATFMPKAEASIRFTTLEDKIVNLTGRMDTIKNVGEGRNDTWALVAALIAVALAAGGFIINYNRRAAA